MKTVKSNRKFCKNLVYTQIYKNVLTYLKIIRMLSTQAKRIIDPCIFLKSMRNIFDILTR